MSNTVPIRPLVHIIPFSQHHTPSFSEVIAYMEEYYIIRMAAPYCYGIVLELTGNGKVNTSVV